MRRLFNWAHTLSNTLLKIQSFSNYRFFTTKKLTHEKVISTLQKIPSDYLSLKLFLWCAKQPDYFHNRNTFNHMAIVMNRLLEKKSLNGILECLQNENSIKPQSLLLLLRIFWHSNNVDLVYQLFDEMPKYKFEPNIYCQNILIDVLFKFRNVDDAFKKFNEMKRPNFLTFNIVVCNLCKFCDFVRIKDVLRRMLENGYYLNDDTFVSVLHCFVKSGKMKESLEILGLMICLGVRLSVNVWTILIDGFCKTGDIFMGVYLFEKMVDSGCEPNVVTCTCLIKNLLKSQMPDKALRIIRTMESNGLAPDLVFYNVLIDSFAKLGRFEDAIRAYQSLLKLGLVPDPCTISSLLKVLCLHGEIFDWLPYLIDDIPFEPDLVLLNSLLSYHCKAGTPSHAVELYKDIIARGFVPDGYSFAGRLAGLCGVGRVDEAVNDYNELVRNGICVDPHIHTVIVNGLVASRKFQSAIDFFRKSAEHNYPLDVVSYTAAIQGLVRGGRIQEAFDLFRQMKEDGVSPNAYTYDVILSGFCRVRDVKMVREILNKMTDGGIIVNDHAFYMVKELFFRSCHAPSSFSLFIEMCHSESMSDKALGAILLKGLRDSGNLGSNLVPIDNIDPVVYDEMPDMAVAVG